MADALTINAGLTIPGEELVVSFARSSGPGGQHVNKTSTRAELRWNVRQTTALDVVRKTRVVARLGARLTNDGELVVACGQTRSQAANLGQCRARMVSLVAGALAVPKVRRPTRPTRGSKERRIDAKKRHSRTKRLRRPPTD